MPERPQSHTVHMKFEGANPRAEVLGEWELAGRVNYFRGNDPSKWQANVKTYGAVRYRAIYDGVDLVYYGNDRGGMEYDFEVAPGADPRQISLKVEGAKAVRMDASGDLIIGTTAGEMRQRRPVVYQEVGCARREVEGGYVVEAGGRVRFKLGEYDESAPLVIDPVLEYSTYLAGSDLDEALGIAVDSSGNAYVTGGTRSADFPTKNTIQSAYGGGDNDAFIIKLNAAGSSLVYSTYLGGSSGDVSYGVAVDPSGNAYVTGITSPDLPTVNAIQNKSAGNTEAFVTKINADGSAFLFSTFLGGGVRIGAMASRRTRRAAPTLRGSPTRPTSQWLSPFRARPSPNLEKAQKMPSCRKSASYPASKGASSLIERAARAASRGSQSSSQARRPPLS